MRGTGRARYRALVAAPVCVDTFTLPRAHSELEGDDIGRHAGVLQAAMTQAAAIASRRDGGGRAGGKRAAAGLGCLATGRQSGR